MTYRLTFAVSGRARFLSHLETVDTLLSALRRAGYDIALSRGMRPRPSISLALPRAVGVESEAEIADVDIEGDPPAEEVGARLAPQLPDGLDVLAVARASGKSPASRLDSVRYAIEVAADRDWAEAARRYAAAEEATVVRRSPKGERRVDVKRYCAEVSHEPPWLVADVRITPDGTARPEEVATAVAATLAGEPPRPKRLVRRRIVLRDGTPGAI